MPESSFKSFEPQVKRYAALMSTDVYNNREFTKELHVLFPQEKTIEELAKEVGEEIFAIYTYKVLESIVNINGTTETLQGTPYDYTPNVFINAQIFSLEELKNLLGNEDRNIKYLEEFGYNNAVKTRQNLYYEYFPEEGESVIHLE